MHRSIVTFLLSIISLFLSALCVVLILHHIVVPNRKHVFHDEFKCTIDSIDHLNQTDYCVSITVAYMDIYGDLRHSLLQNKMAKDSKQCFCTDCRISRNSSKAELHYNDVTLREGQTVMCFMTLLHPESTERQEKEGKALHAILWPTLVFIVSFVATFLSSIDLYKHWFNDLQNKPKKKDEI